MTQWEKGNRLDPSTFDLPVEKIQSGWYSDKYFVRTRETLLQEKKHPRVLMQVFSRKEGIVCGLDEVIAILRLCADRPQELKIHSLYDGEPIQRGDTVILIEGDYSTFAHLETVYLGCLARRSAVATAVYKVVKAAQGKMVLFFPARFGHWSLQTGDGYAAFIGGAHSVSTDANGAWWGKEGIGTIPHGLIAAYNGNTVKATLAFDQSIPSAIPRVALVDFENNCVKTSLEVAQALGERLWGVRLDTAENMKDVSIQSNDPSSYGVCPELVWNVRKALDEHGFSWVKIIVTGGFNEERIKKFVELGVPFDGVGVGSALFNEKIDFTADIVRVDGKPCAKVGRGLKPNPKLVQA